MPNELDKELERKGNRFVRYADDTVILCQSRRSMERVIRRVVPFIERRLFLKVNKDKSQITYISRVKFLHVFVRLLPKGSRQNLRNRPVPKGTQDGVRGQIGINPYLLTQFCSNHGLKTHALQIS